jgi:hypothetical protein
MPVQPHANASAAAAASFKSADLDDLAGLAAGEGALEDRGQAAAERDVVVLDEDSVLQVEAVVDAAAAADGVLIQRAQAGDGLAGVEDFGFGFAAATALTYSLVRVAMPDMRCMRLRMTRSVERMLAALARMTAMAWPFLTRTPSKISGWETTSKRPGGHWRACRRG